MNDKYNILICFAKLGAGGIETACLTQIKEYCRRNYEVYVLAGKGIYTDKLGKLSNVTFIEFDYVEATVTTKVTAKTLSAADSVDPASGAPRHRAGRTHKA